MQFVGVDIGGTFTDLLAYNAASGSIRSLKSLTTYDDLAKGVLCVHAAGLDPAAIAYLFHGTTIVINTVVQRTGSKTALITTTGCRDVLEIARANRRIRAAPAAIGVGLASTSPGTSPKARSR